MYALVHQSNNVQNTIRQQYKCTNTIGYVIPGAKLYSCDFNPDIKEYSTVNPSRRLEERFKKGLKVCV